MIPLLAVAFSQTLENPPLVFPKDWKARAIAAKEHRKHKAYFPPPALRPRARPPRCVAPRTPKRAVTFEKNFRQCAGVV
jgi:hypothetical protein